MIRWCSLIRQDRLQSYMRLQEISSLAQPTLPVDHMCPSHVLQSLGPRSCHQCPMHRPPVFRAQITDTFVSFLVNTLARDSLALHWQSNAFLQESYLAVIFNREEGGKHVRGMTEETVQGQKRHSYNQLFCASSFSSSSYLSSSLLACPA